MSGSQSEVVHIWVLTRERECFQYTTFIFCAMIQGGVRKIPINFGVMGQRSKVHDNESPR